MTRLILIVTVLFLTQPLYAFDVVFKKKATVAGALVTLGDVATIDTIDQTGIALLTVPVANSPAPGEKTFFRSMNIKKYLGTSQNLPEDIDWRGAATIEVNRSGTRINAQRMLEYISEYLKIQSASLPDAEVRFIPTSHPMPFTLPSGNLSCDVIPSHPGILSSSRFSLIFKVDDRVVKNISIRGKLEARATVITAAKPIKRGTILYPEHIRETVLDISNLKDPGFSADDFLGKIIKRTLKTGTPIGLSMVESLPVVYRGEKVKIVIQSGPMLLTATGLAHSDGKLNDLIRVQNLNSSKVVFGRVTGPGVVEVLL